MLENGEDRAAEQCCKGGSLPEHLFHPLCLAEQRQRAQHKPLGFVQRPSKSASISIQAPSLDTCLESPSRDFTSQQ